MIKAIDIHCHFAHGREFEPAESDEMLYNIEFLRREHKRLNVRLSAMAGSFASVCSNKIITEENDYLYARAQEDEFIYQWVVVDPRNEKTLMQAKWMLKNEKCLGIKIHSEYHQYRIAEYADKILSFANDNGTVVLSHLGEYPIETVNRYPNMKLILAHLGTVDYYFSIIQQAKHQNVYTDTSGSASIKNNVIENAVRQIGSEKILFGTDGYSCAFQRGRIDYADITQKDKENILYKNVLRLFPKLSTAFV